MKGNHRSAVLDIARRLLNEGVDLFSHLNIDGLPNRKAYNQFGSVAHSREIARRLLGEVAPSPLTLLQRERDTLHTRFGASIEDDAPAPVAAPAPAPVADASQQQQAALDAARDILAGVFGGGARDSEPDVDEDEVRRIIGDALQPVQGDITLLDGRVSTAESVANKAGAEASAASGDAGTAVQRADAAAVLADSTDKRLDSVIDALNSATPQQKARVRAAVASPSGAQHVLERLLWRFCSPGASRKPLHFAGEPGVGKTHHALLHAKNFDYSVVCAGHEGKGKEDFTGWTLPVGDQFVWKDGELTSAYRSVAIDPVTGDPLPGTVGSCLLILDEWNRNPLDLQSVAIPGLNVRNHPATGEPCYVLDTGRLSLPDGGSASPEFASACGVAQQEFLWAPVAKLAVVATSNEGANFNVNEGDEAQDERFVKKRILFDAAEARGIFASVLGSFGYAPDFADKLVLLVEHTRQAAHVSNVLRKPLSVRLVLRAIECSTDEADIAELVREDLLNHCAVLDHNNVIDQSAATVIEDGIKLLK